jgi:hypothetical protein
MAAKSANDGFFIPEERDAASGICRAGTSNGGMVLSRVKQFGEDQRLVRISTRNDKKTGLRRPDAEHLNSPWWMTREMFDWLISRAFSSSRGVQNVIREQLLLPPEWTDVDCFVQAYPKKNISLSAWFGGPRSVEIAGGSGRWIAAGGEARESWLYQLYIPGLNWKNPQNSQNWLEFEGLYDLTPRPGRGGTPYFPCLSAGKIFVV